MTSSTNNTSNNEFSLEAFVKLQQSMSDSPENDAAIYLDKAYDLAKIQDLSIIANLVLLSASRIIIYKEKLRSIVRKLGSVEGEKLEKLIIELLKQKSQKPLQIPA